MLFSVIKDIYDCHYIHSSLIEMYFYINVSYSWGSMHHYSGLKTPVWPLTKVTPFLLFIQLQVYQHRNNITVVVT